MEAPCFSLHLYDRGTHLQNDGYFFNRADTFFKLTNESVGVGTGLHISTDGWFQKFIHDRMNISAFAFPEVMDVPGAEQFLIPSLTDRMTIEYYNRLFWNIANDNKSQ